MGLHGISIMGYRSFGNKSQAIQDLSKVNIFIGKNNSGKSNILRFFGLLTNIASNSYSHAVKGNLLNSNLDLHWGMNSSTEIKFSLQIKDESYTKGAYQHLKGIFHTYGIRFESEGSVWIPYVIQNINQGVAKLENKEMKEVLRDKYTVHELTVLYNRLKWSGGNIEAILEKITENLDVLKQVNYKAHTVPAFRRITEEDVEWEIHGAGLVKKLNQLKEPIRGREGDRILFEQISTFVKDILGEPDAVIEIPHTVDDIYVVIDNKRLPLESLGTGIHQVVLLAVVVTVLDNALICIEELEIYLHPELQKKFINYIRENTNNQYMITTHSNAVFDCSGVNIYHCWLEEGQTQCCLASSSTQRRSILDDLGYRASDLLQSNCIIWVEGPSDRIYLNKWIRDRNLNLKEGLHYSIMFYGGRLLSHLSVVDSEVNDFILLNRMNRNVGIVIDSDKKASQTPINDTKKRIEQEFSKEGGFCWITKGREIENYINPNQLIEAVKLIHGEGINYSVSGQFSDVTIYRNANKKGKAEDGDIDKVKGIDKVKVARRISDVEFDYGVLDLAKQVDNLVEFIKRCNSL